MRKLILPNLAVQDARGLEAYIRRSSPQNADAFQERFLDTLEGLLTESMGFRRAFPGDPERATLFVLYIHRQPNRVIFFEADDLEVRVKRVLHAARGDLRERTGDAAR